MPNLRVANRRIGLHGLGDATCPSIQQLQGVVDPTDPCQSPVSPGNCPAGTTANFIQGAVGTQSAWTCNAPATVTNTTNTTTVAGIPTNYVLLGLGAIGLIMLLKR